jgi:hypothetical protein
MPQTASTPLDAGKAAAAVIGEIADMIARLTDLIEEETALVRAGRLAAAAATAQRKSELAAAFFAHASLARANRPHLRQAPPELIDRLSAQLDAFRAKLMVNLSVLTTARTVAETIMRGVSTELRRRTLPRTYGASGRPQAPLPRTGAPIAVSCKL